MSLPLKDGLNWGTPQAHGAPRFSLAFPFLSTVRIIEQDYKLSPNDGGHISPFICAGSSVLNSIHPEFRNFYLVEEKNWEVERGGVYKFTRVWANIPSTREEWVSYSWQVPGIGSTGSAYPFVTISTIVNTGGVSVITCAAEHGLSTGDTVLVQYNVIDSAGNQYTRQRLMTATVTGADTYTVPIIVDISPPVTGTMQCRKAEFGRDPLTEVVDCRVVYDYFLPGVTTGIFSPSDIPAIDRLTIIENTGRQTNVLTGNTSPTTTVWLASVAAKDWIVIERSTKSRWKGNIWERITRYVRAI